MSRIYSGLAMYAAALYFAATGNGWAALILGIAATFVIVKA